MGTSLLHKLYGMAAAFAGTGAIVATVTEYAQSNLATAKLLLKQHLCFRKHRGVNNAGKE